MTTRYGSHGDKDVPAPQDSPSLDLVQWDYIIPKWDCDSSDKYNEETDTCCPLAELLEQFWQLQDQFACLKSAIHPPTPMEGLIQLTDKLHYLTMMLQAYPTPNPPILIRNPVQNYAGIHGHLDAIQREANITITLLQHIPTFNRQDSSKIVDWFMDIETSTDILTDSCPPLAEAKSCGLTHTLICEALQAGKCWDKIKGILRLMLCNANIHTFTSCFMEIQQIDNETLAAYVQCF